MLNLSNKLFYACMIHLLTVRTTSCVLVCVCVCVCFGGGGGVLSETLDVAEERL